MTIDLTEKYVQLTEKFIEQQETLERIKNIFLHNMHIDPEETDYEQSYYDIQQVVMETHELSLLVE